MTKKQQIITATETVLKDYKDTFQALADSDKVKTCPICQKDIKEVSDCVSAYHGTAWQDTKVPFQSKVIADIRILAREFYISGLLDGREPSNTHIRVNEVRKGLNTTETAQFFEKLEEHIDKLITQAIQYGKHN